MASETGPVEVAPISTCPSDRLVGMVGGVFDRGGVLIFGVWGRVDLLSTPAELSIRLSLVIAAAAAVLPVLHEYSEASKRPLDVVQANGE